MTAPDFKGPLPEYRPELKLFGFQLTYATGAIDWGLIVATDKETAQLHIEGLTLAGIESILITEQVRIVDLLTNQFNGIAFFTGEPACN